jgi:hypothetical protein
MTPRKIAPTIPHKREGAVGIVTAFLRPRPALEHTQHLMNIGALFPRIKRSAQEANHSLPVSSLAMIGLLLHYTVLIHDRCSVKQKDNIQVQTG